MYHAGVSGLTIGRLSSYLSRASYLLKKRQNQLKFNNKKMINKSNPHNRQQINSHDRGFFRLFRVKLCKYANLRIYFNCTETRFLALIFASYTLYSHRTKNEPTAHEKRKLKAKRNIPRWNKPKICGTQKAVTRSKRKSPVAKGEQANRAKKEKVLNGQFQFNQISACGQQFGKFFFTKKKKAKRKNQRKRKEERICECECECECGLIRQFSVS